MGLELQLLIDDSEAAAVDWRALVSHRLWVEADSSLESVQERFRQEPVDYLPVVEQQQCIGLVSRAQVGTQLGARFGFALYAKHPIREHRLAEYFSLTVNAPLLPTLQAALGRPAASFDDDVVLTEPDGELVGVVPTRTLVQLQSQLLAQKLAELHRQKQVLAERNVELQRSNRELQDFAYIASHDLQEPLRKIQAFADRLVGKYGPQLDGPGRDYLVRMQSAAGRLQSLINDLLQFSRVTTQSRPFELVNLAALAREVVEDLEVRLEQTRGRIELGPLPALEGDPLQLRLLLQNLLGNALKFHRPGVPPLVQVQARRDNGQWELTVRDNGIGFEPHLGERIFGVFQRLHGREQYEGNGVGLAICRKILDRHRGTIRAEGQPNQGALFRVRLPAPAVPGENT